MPYPAFHFIILAVGELLKVSKTVTPLKVQDFLSEDSAFATRVPLDECRLALTLMEDSGFIKKTIKNEYQRVLMYD